MTIRLVEPRLGRVSGGLVFNRAVTEAAGGRIVRHTIDGDWSRPGRAEATAVAELIGSSPEPVLLDGLIATAAPALVEPAVRSGAESPRRHVLVHSLTGEDEAGTAAAERERRALSAAAGVIATSRFTAATLSLRCGIRAAAVLPGNPTRAQSAGDGGGHFVCVGALTANKGQLFLAQVLHELQGAAVAWRCSFAGPTVDTDYEQALRRACALLAPGRTELLGELSAAGLDALLHSADLLLLPSLTEAYGMVVAEAAAAGIPAFVTAGTGAEESLHAGLALPHDPTAWTGALRRWCTDAEFRTQLQTEARSRRSGAVRDWTTTADEVVQAVDDQGGRP